MLVNGSLKTKVQICRICWFLWCNWASQVVLVVKNSLDNAGDIKDLDLILGSGRSPGGRHGSPLQYSCLENPMDREAWWAIVHSVARSQIWLKGLNKYVQDTNILTVANCKVSVWCHWIWSWGVHKLALVIWWELASAHSWTALVSRYYKGCGDDTVY